MSGSMMPVTTELEDIFVAVTNSGAKHLMLPAESRPAYDKLKKDLKNRVEVIFYSTPLDAANKALDY